MHKQDKLRKLIACEIKYLKEKIVKGEFTTVKRHVEVHGIK